MAIEVKIPAVGESITSGVVSAWRKKSGEFVNEGETPPEKKKEPVEKKREPEAVEKTVEEREKKPPPEEEKPLSPAVRHIVEEEKLEPEKIPGSGRSGRLTKADVLAAAEERGKADLSAVASAKADGRFIRKKMSPL